VIWGKELAGSRSSPVAVFINFMGMDCDLGGDDLSDLGSCPVGVFLLQI
jgi:hypothetical protein